MVVVISTLQGSKDCSLSLPEEGPWSPQLGSNLPRPHPVLSEEWGLEGIPTDFFFRLFPVFLFLHPNSFPCVLDLPVILISRAPWEEKKGQSDTGGNSQPCHICGPARPLLVLRSPGSPLLQLLSARLVSRPGCLSKRIWAGIQACPLSSFWKWD